MYNPFKKPVSRPSQPSQDVPAQPGPRTPDMNPSSPHQDDFDQRLPRNDGDQTDGARDQRDPHDQRDPDETAAMLDQLHAEIETLRAERDQAQNAYKHSLAEFANYQRRSHLSEQQAKEQAVRSVLSSVIPVVDHFEMALTQNPETSSAKSVMAGVTIIKEELLKALAQNGVGVVNPQRGDVFDAMKHKAIVQQPADDVEPGNIVQTVRTGFTLQDRVVRPAEVIVAS